MATFNFFNAFKADSMNGVHNLASNEIMVALCNSSNAPVAANSVLADLTQVSYTNLSSRVVSVTSSTQTAGAYKFIVADLVLTASGAVATFRYVAFYNNTAAGKNLIGWVDRGSDITLAATGDTATIDADQTNGLFSM